jgi:tRNA (guanine37-N1)-methyltransferase
LRCLIMAEVERGYDILGNIAIVKFQRGAKAAEKKKFALQFLKERGSVRTVLEKSEKFKGRLRTLKTKFVAGEKTKEALYRENGCAFRFNVDSCYFSPRLASERLEIAKFVKKGEKVLVMFGGVAPFAIVIARLSKAGKVLSVELGRECAKYAEQNVKMNKVNVDLIQGDVRRIVPKLKERWDRIVMSRPNLKDSFLDVAFPAVKKGGIIHYYGFYPENEVEKMKELILREAKKAGRKVKILNVKKAGDIGVRKFRYRVDLKVLN